MQAEYSGWNTRHHVGTVWIDRGEIKASTKQFHGTIVDGYAGMAADKSADNASVCKGHILNGRCLSRTKRAAGNAIVCR